MSVRRKTLSSKDYAGTPYISTINGDAASKLIGKLVAPISKYYFDDKFVTSRSLFVVENWVSTDIYNLREADRFVLGELTTCGPIRVYKQAIIKNIRTGKRQLAYLSDGWNVLTRLCN